MMLNAAFRSQSGQQPANRGAAAEAVRAAQNVCGCQSGTGNSGAQEKEAAQEGTGRLESRAKNDQCPMSWMVFSFEDCQTGVGLHVTKEWKSIRRRHRSGMREFEEREWKMLPLSCVSYTKAWFNVHRREISITVIKLINTLL